MNEISSYLLVEWSYCKENYLKIVEHPAEHVVEHPVKHPVEASKEDWVELQNSWPLVDFAMEFRILQWNLGFLGIFFRIAFLIWYRVIRNVTTGSVKCKVSKIYAGVFIKFMVLLWYFCLVFHPVYFENESASENLVVL